jgi:hypothetical protein
MPRRFKVVIAIIQAKVMIAVKDIVPLVTIR